MRNDKKDIRKVRLNNLIFGTSTITTACLYYGRSIKKCIVIPTIRLMLEIDKVTPFFKHSFWCEECETRALLSIKVSDNRVNNLKKYDDGSAYFDLPISCECFNKVILGPELCEDDIKELKAINGKIIYENLETIISEGTGVITNR